MPARGGELTLNDIRQEFPGWIMWRGTGRLLYARRDQTPLGRYDVWGADPLDLQDAIVCFLRTEERDTRPADPAEHTPAEARGEPPATGCVTGSGPTGAGGRESLPGWPAGLVLPPLSAPWWGWPGWREAITAQLGSRPQPAWATPAGRPVAISATQMTPTRGRTQP